MIYSSFFFQDSKAFLNLQLKETIIIKELGLGNVKGVSLFVSIPAFNVFEIQELL